MDRFRSSTLARCWIFLAVFAFAQQISASDHFLAVGDVSTLSDVSKDDEAPNRQAASSPCHDTGQHDPSLDVMTENISSTSAEASGSCCESGCVMGACHGSSAALYTVSLFSADPISDLPDSPIAASRIERSTSLFRPPIFS